MIGGERDEVCRIRAGRTGRDRLSTNAMGGSHRRNCHGGEQISMARHDHEDSGDADRGSRAHRIVVRGRRYCARRRPHRAALQVEATVLGLVPVADPAGAAPTAVAVIVTTSTAEFARHAIGALLHGRLFLDTIIAAEYCEQTADVHISDPSSTGIVVRANRPNEPRIHPATSGISLGHSRSGVATVLPAPDAGNSVASPGTSGYHVQHGRGGCWYPLGCAAVRSHG